MNYSSRATAAYHTALFLLALTTLAVFSPSTRATTLQELRTRGVARIAIANEIPYGYTNLDGEAQGIGPDVARHVMRQLGVKKIAWSITNFSSLIPGLKAHRFDIVAAEMAILPQRCREVLFSNPNSSYGEGLLVAKNNPDKLHSFEQFIHGHLKVAVMAGADQQEMLSALGVPQHNVVIIASNADAISTVSTGRADAYAATSLTVAQLAKKSKRVQAAANFSDPVIHGAPVRSWGAFAFANDSRALRDAFNTALAKFKTTPAWHKAMAHYGFSDTDMKASLDKSESQLCSQPRG
ncbi:MAG: ectoine/hydroxyectoine ABC transporter substrate-binding protein EhuB [Burkholderiaceae bacterium]|nr:MAG: ectoine/hydroxyectoine ABC transporter substrate-binding protein EhuB [Burkholderiaceae bacterium]TAM03787.1 MAG: ectoine/hydroxyectoine ABC transporter substrate-binding protein EhuB [Pusillimonas sp.]